jgi:predicted PurR-regulated permease PerM
VLAPLAGALGVILLLAFLVFKPFLLVFTVSASVALLLAPLQRRLSGLLRGRSSLAAALLVVVATAAILVPVLSSTAILVAQGASFFSWVKPRLQPAEIERIWVETLPTRFPWLQQWLLASGIELGPLISRGLTEVAGAINTILQRVLAGFTTALVELVLFLLMLFFLLRDGGRLRAAMRSISPFSEAQETHIFDHLGKTVKGVLGAMVVVPLVQGFVATLGFWAFGVPSPILWGVAVTLAAMVPILGSPLGWVPACVYTLLLGRPAAAGGLFVFGVAVVSGIDNVVKPLVLRGTAQIHPLLGFLSMLGGILAFGGLGFLVGPVILSLVLSAMRIYRLDILRPPAERSPAPASLVASGP